MISIENDKEIFEADYPAIVPFLLQEQNGEVYIEAYSGIEDIAVQYELRFENEYFSDAALRWLNANIQSYLDKNGYYREERGVMRWYHAYILDDLKRVNTALIRDDSVLLTEPIKSVTLIKPAEHLELSMPVFATVIDGVAVSVATVNPHSEDQNCLEITAETAPKFRKRGYGASNVAALSKYLLENGYSAAYCCSRYNRASKKIAERVGFECDGRFYAVDAYKKY